MIDTDDYYQQELEKRCEVGQDSPASTSGTPSLASSKVLLHLLRRGLFLLLQPLVLIARCILHLAYIDLDLLRVAGHVVTGSLFR